MLEEKMMDLNISDRFQLFVYEKRNHENITANNDQLNNQVEEFLSKL